MKDIEIISEYITLGKFLKHINLISSGGESKIFIINNKIIINKNKNKIVTRGVKLFPGDIIFINNESFKIVNENL